MLSSPNLHLHPGLHRVVGHHVREDAPPVFHAARSHKLNVGVRRRPVHNHPAAVLHRTSISQLGRQSEGILPLAEGRQVPGR